MRAKYEPLALGAPSEAAFYRVLNQMIGELGQSHMLIPAPAPRRRTTPKRWPAGRGGRRHAGRDRSAGEPGGWAIPA